MPSLIAAFFGLNNAHANSIPLTMPGITFLWPEGGCFNCRDTKAKTQIAEDHYPEDYTTLF